MTVSEMLSKARIDAGLSQKKLADKLGVSRSTIANWESGYTSISLLNAIEGFRALGVPMYPYLISAIYGEEISSADDGVNIVDVRKFLLTFVNELDEFHARELLFLLQGNHGSSPTGTLDLITTYLHLPLTFRVCIAESIVTAYEIMDASGELANTNYVLPSLETLRKFTAAAKTAVMEGKDTYV